MKLLKNLTVSLVTLLILLLCVEGIFRFFRKEDALKLSMGRVDTRYHHSFEPYSRLHMVSSPPGEFDVWATINNYGLRGPNFTLEKKAGQKRIFIIGDSYTFGVGAKDDETIPAQLQRLIDPLHDKFQFLNLGRGSTSPLIYYLRLRDEVPKFKPDLVVMLLDFSDLWEDWNFEKNLVLNYDGTIQGLSPYYEYGKFNLWNYLRANSVFASYLHNKVVRTLLQIQKLGFRRYVETLMKGKRAKAVIATTENETIEFDGKLFLRGGDKKEEIERHFKRTAHYILMCRDLVEKSGAEFMLVIYPYGIHVGPKQWSRGRVFWGFKEGQTYTDRFSFDLIEQFAKQNQIPIVNLLDTLRAHAEEPLYFEMDGHFTPHANGIVAKALKDSPVFQAEFAKMNGKTRA